MLNLQMLLFARFFYFSGATSNMFFTFLWIIFYDYLCATATDSIRLFSLLSPANFLPKSFKNSSKSSVAWFFISIFYLCTLYRCLFELCSYSFIYSCSKTIKMNFFLKICKFILKLCLVLFVRELRNHFFTLTPKRYFKRKYRVWYFAKSSHKAK